MKVMYTGVAVLALAAGACATSTPTDVQQLRALHEKVLQAHRASDVELLLEDSAPEGVSANRGVVTRSTADDTRARLGPYLASTRFHEYRDLIAPVVAVSDDGSLGWVLAQVYARGTQTGEDGREEPLEFTCAWIELYRRQGGKWLRVGNVSNFKE